MSANDEQNPGDDYRSLSQRLSKISSVEEKSHREGEAESETLAHALTDIDELCRRITGTIMPRLREPSATDTDVLDSLSDLGELFREFLYHVRDPYYFRYLPGCESGNGDD